MVEHIPADMSGMKVEEKTRSHQSPVDGKYALNPPHKKGALPASKLVGLRPTTSRGKLVRQKGVRVITESFGVAILDYAIDPKDRFKIIPWFKVYARIHEGIDGEPGYIETNAGKYPRILRRGMVIRIGKFRVRKPTRVLEDSEWMVESIGDFDDVFKVDLKPRDIVNARYKELDPADPEKKKKIKKTREGCKLGTELERIYEGGLTILSRSLTGKF